MSTRDRVLDAPAEQPERRHELIVETSPAQAPAKESSGVWSDWRSVVAPQDGGPDVAVLHESAELKVVLVALAAGQALPAHPGPAACFHILSGTGAVIVDQVEHPVSTGAIVVAAPGTQRAVRAATPLVFLGNLGDPASENGPQA